MDRVLQTISCLCVLGLVLHVKGQDVDQFYPFLITVAHFPETGRHSDLNIYAINKLALLDVEVSITKEGGLPSDAVETGLIIKDGENFGCFLRVGELNLFPQLRYGQYRIDTSKLTEEGGSIGSGYTFVKPKLDKLDTRGVQTMTIYPRSPSSNDLPEKVQIGVKWTPGCNRIIWSKGKRRNVNTGPRLVLKTTEDAGLYNIRRPGRGKRGCYVQILVIAATCPRNHWYDDESSSCKRGSYECKNGGVLANDRDMCVCSPFFFLDNCDCYKSKLGDQFLIGLSEISALLYCEDLPGGNRNCKGYLFCLGDNYGCACSPGWYGNACDRACPKGKWGASCRQTCPRHEPDCSRFYGPSRNLIANGCGP